MSAFGLALPLRIRLIAEACVVERIAQTIARALTDEAEYEEPRRGG